MGSHPKEVGPNGARWYVYQLLIARRRNRTRGTIRSDQVTFLYLTSSFMSESSLVLSYVEDYAARDIAPFLASLRSTGYDGDVVFFTFNLEDDCDELFAKHGVRAIPVRRVDMKSSVQIPEGLADALGIPSSFRPDGALNIRLARLFGSLGVERYEVVRRIARYLWHCNSGRFFYYQEFLEHHPEYEHVLIADVRDVVFQRSPFDRDLGDVLSLFEEFPATPLGDQVDNATWIERLYGPVTLDELAPYPIVCAGVMLGPHARVLECVQQIAHESVTNYVGWGTDQGTLNYLVRTGQLGAVDVHPYGSGPAMHVGIAPRETIRTDEEGRVLNRDGEVCSIIHQYDRHPELARSVRSPAKQGPAPVPE